VAIITPEQRREIEKAGEHPIRVADPETHTEYVILKADVYEKMRAVMESEKIDPSLFEFGEFFPLNQ
jgi:hypothetical protein